ncbi:hypothetical protein [Roseibium sp.]|uniref:hypothetical protein n=1 Tax=Roseibium sp. TaxID=1936156 RepID=UPI003B525C7A
MRGLAEIWGWKKTKVERFLEALALEENIGTDAGTGVTVITICNYERFQNAPKGKKTTKGTEAGQKRDASGTILIPEEIPEEKPENTPKSPEGKYPKAFEEFWSVFPKRKGSSSKELALKKWQGRVKGGVSPELIHQGAVGYAKARLGQDAQFTQQATTWLNQAGWEQYAQPQGPQLVHSTPEQITVSARDDPEFFNFAIDFHRQRDSNFDPRGKEHIKVPSGLRDTFNAQNARAS